MTGVKSPFIYYQLSLSLIKIAWTRMAPFRAPYREIGLGGLLLVIVVTPALGEVSLPTPQELTVPVVSSSELSELPTETVPDIMPSNAMAQINNVFELREVTHQDWAFEALNALIDKYQCLAKGNEKSPPRNSTISGSVQNRVRKGV